MSEIIDRQKLFSGTKDIATHLQFDIEKISQYLQGCIKGFRGPITVKQFKGGQSNPTYLLETSTKKYVLRRKPPGKLLPSAHAVEREFRIVKALNATNFPVPQAYHLCDDISIIGSAFYIMSYEEGRIFWYVNAPAIEPIERTEVFNTLNETLASLHNFDPDSLNLGDFGKPENYVSRQVNRWSKQYTASKTEEIVEMEKLMAWLPENIPSQQATRIVHGDFRLDNVIIKNNKPEALAVLDWELSTLGDPIADFTYHCMQWVMPPNERGAGTGSLVGLDLKKEGIPSLEEYITAYEKRTGFHVGQHLDFYFAYNFFRLAAILQGIIGRVRDGTAANANASTIATLIRPLANTAWSYAQKAQI